MKQLTFKLFSFRGTQAKHPDGNSSVCAFFGVSVNFFSELLKSHEQSNGGTISSPNYRLAVFYLPVQCINVALIEGLQRLPANLVSSRNQA